MTIESFKAYVKARKALNTEDIHHFMDDMSNEARRITFRLNTAYHVPDKVRELLSELFGYSVPQTLRVFPPRPRRNNNRGWLPNRTQRSVCYTQSRISSGRP